MRPQLSGPASAQLRSGGLLHHSVVRRWALDSGGWKVRPTYASHHKDARSWIASPTAHCPASRTAPPLKRALKGDLEGCSACTAGFGCVQQQGIDGGGGAAAEGAAGTGEPHFHGGRLLDG